MASRFEIEFSPDAMDHLDHNKPSAALVTLDAADIETLSLSTNADFLAMIQRSRERHSREGGVGLQEARRRLGVPPLKLRRPATKK
jgi:hypothetical protein